MRRRLVLCLVVVLFLAAGLFFSTRASAQEGIIHVVQRGDTVGNLAWRYGVSSRAIVQANRLRNPNLIYVGQRLLIPVPGGAVPTPTPCLCEEIVIFGPTRDITITSPVTVTGLASGFEQSIVVAVLDGSAGEIGRAYGSVVGEYGRQGAFTTTVTFTVPANTQPGRIQVWNVSPRDGAIEHLNSVPVIVQGLELDPLLTRLADALSARDYVGLRGLMADSFAWMLYRGATTVLTPTQAIGQVQRVDAGPAAPRVDFSVDARKLLGDRVTFAPTVVHVVYSVGWGASGKDDVFLLIGDVAGRARWSGLLYVPQELIDYR